MGLFCLIVAQMLAAPPPVDAPIVPEATPLTEAGRYESARSYEDTLKYYRRAFRKTGGIQWRHVVNLPGVKAEHIKSMYSKTNWQGINIYEHKGQVRVYVIPRAEEKPTKKTNRRKNGAG